MPLSKRSETGYDAYGYNKIVHLHPTYAEKKFKHDIPMSSRIIKPISIKKQTERISTFRKYFGKLIPETLLVINYQNTQYNLVHDMTKKELRLFQEKMNFTSKDSSEICLEELEEEYITSEIRYSIIQELSQEELKNRKIEELSIKQLNQLIYFYEKAIQYCSKEENTIDIRGHGAFNPVISMNKRKRRFYKLFRYKHRILLMYVRLTRQKLNIAIKSTNF